MTSYQVEHSVPVRLMAFGEEIDGAVGISIESDGRRIFGLVSSIDSNRITHMSYGLDYFEPETILIAMRNNGEQWWRFLATGDDRSDVKISIRELEVAFYRLKLINSMGECE
jgi:hypothetical protein